MIKNLLLLTAILFPLLSGHAQIGTGGVIPPLVTRGSKIIGAKTAIYKMEKNLVARDALCSPHDRLIKDKDLMQSYLKLSLFKDPKKSAEQCNEVNKYFACLNDKKSKEFMKELLENDQASTVLADRYKISDKDAKAMLKFFDQLGKKVK